VNFDNPFKGDKGEDRWAKLFFVNKGDRHLRIETVNHLQQGREWRQKNERNIGPRRWARLNTCMGCVWRIVDRRVNLPLKYIKIDQNMQKETLFSSEICPTDAMKCYK
jgi:hypothetical protein